ncbi:hypothetical protein VB715_16655 [Crocosphaera sp. UHCC 0190]|nr:hypothetical protein [Crocosphaera sp. UHCC 0190]MEA5511407.1 hypothetical protein [Crocosphaera sp. UHCC 0190]
MKTLGSAINWTLPDRQTIRLHSEGQTSNSVTATKPTQEHR